MTVAATQTLISEKRLQSFCSRFAFLLTCDCGCHCLWFSTQSRRRFFEETPKRKSQDLLSTSGGTAETYLQLLKKK